MAQTPPPARANQRLSVDSLLLFSEVVASGSINRGAIKLGLPKSTISRRLRQLEQEIGAQLVKRGARRLLPTDIGRALLERCERIAAEVALAGLQATEMQTELRGELRVSLPSDFGSSWLARVIGEFSRLHPDIRIYADVNNRWVDVSEEHYDIALHLGAMKGSQNLPMRPLASLSRGLYASPKYLAENPPPTSVEDLAEHDCVMHELQISEGIWAFAVNEDLQTTARRRLTTNNIGIVRDIVIQGVGIGVMPDVLCAGDVRSGRLVQVLPDMRLPQLTVTATFLHRRNVPRRTRAFLDFLVEQMRPQT